MMRTSTVLVVCVAALLFSSCHAARSRQLTQAIASSSSVAGPGESVSSDSKATSKGGELTVSKVAATGSGPGTTVDCAQEAKSGQIKSKECGGVAQDKGASSGSTSASGTSSTSAGVPTWDKAPACKKTPKDYTISYDSNKKPWGFDEASCALRGADGKALA